MTFNELSGIDKGTHEGFAAFKEAIRDSLVEVNKVEEWMILQWLLRDNNRFPGDIVHDFSYIRQNPNQKLRWHFVECGSVIMHEDCQLKHHSEVLKSFLLWTDENGMVKEAWETFV